MSEEIQKEDDFHFLIEMQEAMGASLDNLKKVISEQEYLINTLEATKDEHFDEFIKESKEQLEDLKAQQATLTVRYEEFCDVISLCDDKTIKEAILLFTDSISMFASK